MPWLKEGDKAANHPIVLSVLEMEDADDRILNECFGFVNRCATQSASHEQDYIITVGTAMTMAGSISRYQALIKAAKYCGYLTDTVIIVDGEERKAFKLVEDNDLFHMILKDERAWANQRKKDSRNVKLTTAVRLRDGDACRYCGKTVSWNDRVSGRAASYDHTNPGQAATVETYVVCCRECNGKRGDDPDSTWSTLPAPTQPLYGPETVEFLANHDITVKPTYTRNTQTPALADGKQLEEGTPAVELPKGEVPAEDEATAITGPSSDSDTAADDASPAATDAPAADLPDRSRSGTGQRSPGPSHVGTGRVGTGQVGTGRGGSTEHTTPPKRSRNKRRRPRDRGRN
ncbi:HNH endonuclease [Paenarthrobacter sp. YAF11_1]|uniref:HNH endonuclease n=1 Tax=Paenarthrobacter sp. YAF11_1 TaxID=3233074 RepID=UPI003F9799A1